jgi:ubiquinone/menaquinone biosynthesis C-methylase UbiE
VSVETDPIVDAGELRDRVRDMYTDVAEHPEGDYHFELGRPLAERLGYPPAWLDAVPADALASFAGVGHMLDVAGIQRAETILDLGSGSGTDAFIAAYLTGPAGRVIGVDMTDAQLAKARRLAAEAGVRQASFVKGLIEAPPVEPGSVDVVISNGVVNLAPEKATVFRAAAEALRPGGRLAIADIVSERELIERTRRNVALWAACIAGAVPRGESVDAIEAAGMRVESVRPNPTYRFLTDRAREAADKYGVASVTVLAIKR